MSPTFKANAVWNSIYAVICFSMFTFLLWITYKVFKIIKFNDKILLSMIACLNLELISKVFFYSVNAYEITRDTDAKAFPPIMIISLILPILFLSMAILINLRNWFYYYIKIGDMAYHMQFQ